MAVSMYDFLCVLIKSSLNHAVCDCWHVQCIHTYKQMHHVCSICSLLKRQRQCHTVLQIAWENQVTLRGFIRCLWVWGFQRQEGVLHQCWEKNTKVMYNYIKEYSTYSKCRFLFK